AGGTLDTVITVIATLEELTKRQPEITAKQLWLSGRQVGRDVITICTIGKSKYQSSMWVCFNRRRKPFNRRRTMEENPIIAASRK
ncbi:YibE/F family protein, partial [Enterococcus faecium]|uniref:YibE/F family protein n=1 Tax=Enterococcus faecium TaxID=1352 RepID=UPI003977C55B